MVTAASYVSVVDESVQLRGLPADDQRRVVIRNGIDPDDLVDGAAIVPPPDSGRFRLSHVGSLYGTRDAAPVFSAIRDLIDHGKLDPNRFEIRIVGHASLNGARLDSLPVTFTGYLDHDRAVAEMASASALLFYQPPECPGSSGKIYEYLTSGRPILCVAEPNNLGYRLVEDLGAGECADVRNSVSVGRAVERIVSDWHRGSLAVDSRVREHALRRFSRRQLAGELARVLRAAIDGF